LVASLGAGADAIIKYGARIYDLGQRFNVSTTDLQQFGNAAEKNGASLDSLAMGFNRLDVAIARARAGSAEYQHALENLGILDWADKSLTLSNAMLDIGASEMNAADMTKVLGKNGTEFRETLRNLATGSDQLSGAISPKLVA